MKKTIQRSIIFDYLKNNTSHPTAYDIHRAIAKENAIMSFATVYNTLAVMKKEGIVRELAIKGAHHKRYDGNILPHAHLICNACGKVVDVKLSFRLEISEEHKQGFDVQTDDIYMYGHCPACKNE